MLELYLKSRIKLKEAEKAYKKAIRIEPNNAEAYNNLGNALGEQGKLQDAINVYKKALNIKQNYATAHRNNLAFFSSSLQARSWTFQ